MASSKPSDLIQFLKAQVREADPDCVSRAIVRLGNFRTPSGVDVLIDLLDFQRPESALEKVYLYDAHDKFPAVSALFSIGLPAVPALLAKLGSGDVTEVVRSNGIRTIVSIYRDDLPRSIIAFMKAAGAAKTQVEAVRFESCARDAVGLCSKSWRDRCEAVLKAN